MNSSTYAAIMVSAINERTTKVHDWRSRKLEIRKVDDRKRYHCLLIET
jgi:hypothetical protein